MATETESTTYEDDYHGDICYTQEQRAIRAIVDLMDHKILHIAEIEVSCE